MRATLSGITLTSTARNARDALAALSIAGGAVAVRGVDYYPNGILTADVSALVGGVEAQVSVGYRWQEGTGAEGSLTWRDVEGTAAAGAEYVLTTWSGATSPQIRVSVSVWDALGRDGGYDDNFRRGEYEHSDDRDAAGDSGE